MTGTTPDGYYLSIDSAGCSIWRADNGSPTQLGSAFAFTVSSGDSLGLSVVGSTLTAYYKSGSGSWTTLGSRTDATYSAAGNLMIIATDAGAVLDDFGGGTITATRTLASSGTVGVAGTFTPGSDSYTITGSTVDYNGGAQTVASMNYNNLTFSNNGAKTLQTGTTTLSGNLTLNGTASSTTVVGLTVSGNLAVNAGTTFTVAGYDLTITGTTTVTGASSNLVINNSSGTKLFTGLVTVDTSGTWNNSGNSAVTMRGGLTFNGSTFTAGSGVYTFNTTASQNIGGSSALSIPSITVTSPTVLTNAGTLTVSTALAGTGGFTNGTNATLNFGASTLDVTTFTASASGNLVNYNRSGTQTVLAVTYHDLTVSGSNTKTLANNIIIGGDLNISAGTLSTGSNYNITIAGNWTNSGTFTANSGTVTFNGGDGSTQTLAGNTTFNNFTAEASSSSGRTLAFTDGSTQTVSGTWTMTGASGKIITLTRTGSSSNWTINPTAASVTYVAVDHSTNSGVSFCATYSSGSNNTGWDISASGTCGSSLGLSCGASVALADYTLGNANNYNEDTPGSALCTVTGSSAGWTFTMQSTNLTSAHNTITNSNVLLRTDSNVTGGLTITDSATGVTESSGDYSLDSIRTVLTGDSSATGTYNNRPTMRIQNLNGLFNEDTTGTITFTVQ